MTHKASSLSMSEPSLKSGRFREASKLAERTDKGNPLPNKGDLVKLHRLNQDHQRSHKLEPR